MKGLTSLSRAMALGFFRDRTAMFFTILFPLMFLVLFGGIFKDQGSSPSTVAQIGSVPLIDQIPADQRGDLEKVLTITSAASRDQALEDVRKGDVDAAVEQSGQNIIVHFSAADQVKAAVVQGQFNALVQSGNLAAAGVTTPAYRLTSQQVEDESLQVIQYFTPGLLAWAVATGAMFGAALTLVTWRQKRILRRLRLSPVNTATIATARVGVSIAIAFVQAAIFIGVGLLPFFGLQLSGYWWMAIPLVALGTLAFLSLGLLAGAFAKTAEAAGAIANIIVLPMAFLSGAFFPLEGAPQWLQTVSQAMPMRHLVDAMLDVMVRGQPPGAVLPQIGILAAFTAVVSVIAVALFKWDDA
jgi:ABC-2 type transport system permease protein